MCLQDFFDDLFGDDGLETDYNSPESSSGGSVDGSSDSGHGSPGSCVTSSSNSPVCIYCTKKLNYYCFYA